MWSREPNDPLYAKQWRFDLPANHAQPLDARVGHRHIATSCVHTMPWWAKYLTKNHAGAGDTTTT